MIPKRLLCLFGLHDLRVVAFESWAQEEQRRRARTGEPSSWPDVPPPPPPDRPCTPQSIEKGDSGVHYGPEAGTEYLDCARCPERTLRAVYKRPGLSVREEWIQNRKLPFE